MTVRRLISILLVGAYLLPIATNALGYTFNELQLFATRPIIVIGILGGSALLSCLPGALRLPGPIWLLFGLEMLRLLDSVLLHRVDSTNFSPINATANSLFLIAVTSFAASDRRRFMAMRTPILILCLVVVLGTLFWDVVAPGYFSNVSGRAAGLFLNCNEAAIAVTVYSGLLMGFYSRSAVLPVLIMVLALLGVFVTYSRGGFAMVLMMSALFMLRNVRLKRAVPWIVGLAVSFYVVVVIEQTTSSGDLNISGRADAMLWRVDQDYDDTGRIGLLQEGIHLCLQRPLVGYGAMYSYAPLESSEGQGPHNMAVAVWLDSGLSGLVLYVTAIAWAVCYVWKHCRTFLPVASALTAATLFSHTLMESIPFILGWIVVLFSAMYYNDDDAVGPNMLVHEGHK